VIVNLTGLDPFEPDSLETQRRRSMLLHLALGASLVLYLFLLFQVTRSRASHGLSPSTATRSFLFGPLLIFGVVQFAVLAFVARKKLRSAPGPPAARARQYFLLRAVASETLGLLGLQIGMPGGPLSQTLLFFGLAFAGLLLTAPTREAWADALRRAEDPGP